MTARGADVLVDEVADGVWTASSGTYRTLFFAGDSTVFAVNTFGTPAAAEALSAAIAKTVPGKPLSGLITTVDHLDHSGYGRELGGPQDVVGHALTARVIQHRGADGQLPITRTIGGDGMMLDLDGVEVELIYAGPSVGTGNLAVLLPQRRVLFVVGPQCNARYGIFPDFHFRHVTRVWRVLAEQEADTFVPGRYAVLDASTVRRAADYVDALAVACQMALCQGVPVWEVETMGGFVGGQLRAEYGDLEGFDEHVAAAAIRIVHHYLMGGWGIEDTAHPERLLDYAS